MEKKNLCMIIGIMCLYKIKKEGNCVFLMYVILKYIYFILICVYIMFSNNL